jgi:acetoin utilization protein AcuB
MTKAIPIKKYMTSGPHSVGDAQTVAHAAAVMQRHKIRHLPVLHGGKLVGVISDRDLRLLESLPDVKPTLFTVSDAMATNVYAVSPETPLLDVVRKMATDKYGSAIVMENDRVVGIFTTVDLCNAFVDMLGVSAP